MYDKELTKGRVFEILLVLGEWPPGLENSGGNRSSQNRKGDRIMATEQRKLDLERIWKKKHPDFKVKRDNGERMILVWRKEGTCLVHLETLSDKEIARLLPRN